MTFFLLMLLSGNLFSQSSVEGYVKSEADNRILPFSNAYISNTSVGTITDSFGYFKLFIPDSLFDRDLIIQHLGYHNDTLDVTDVINGNQIVYLTQSNVDLPLYEVRSKKNSKNLKRKRRGSKRNQNDGFYYGIAGDETALFISNEDQSKGYISKVRFYITDKGNSENPFRVRLYQIDEKTQAPGKAILNVSIIASASEGNEWVNINLLKYAIKLPKNGFFISMEWLPPKTNNETTNSVENKLNTYNALGATDEFGMIGLTYLRNYRGDWIVPIIPMNSINVLNAKIGAEILIRKNND